MVIVDVVVIIVIEEAIKLYVIVVINVREVKWLPNALNSLLIAFKIVPAFINQCTDEHYFVNTASSG